MSDLTANGAWWVGMLALTWVCAEGLRLWLWWDRRRVDTH